jgi:hypothetical protein
MQTRSACQAEGVMRAGKLYLTENEVQDNAIIRSCCEGVG